MRPLHQVGGLGGGEGPECRICLAGDHPEALVAACNCIGSMRFAHVACLEVRSWLDLPAALQSDMGDVTCKEHRTESAWPATTRGRPWPPAAASAGCAMHRSAAC